MLEMSKQEQNIAEGQEGKTLHQAVSPGHSRTVLNRLTSKRDPFEDTKVSRGGFS
jgi:hypothetical protein